MCGKCRPSLSAARQRACISKTSDMFLKVTDKTDKSPSRRHEFSSEHASDVLTKPTEGLRWFLPGEVACRGPREQPRIPTRFVARSGPVLRRLRCAPRWAVGQRTPPGRPTYVSVAPLALGGVCARLGPTWWWADRGRRADLPRLGTCAPSSSTLWVGRRVAAAGDDPNVFHGLKE